MLVGNSYNTAMIPAVHQIYRCTADGSAAGAVSTQHICTYTYIRAGTMRAYVDFLHQEPVSV